MPGALSFAGEGVRATQISLDDANLLRGHRIRTKPHLSQETRKMGHRRSIAQQLRPFKRILNPI
jgi:hypothetical protein